MLWGSGKQRVFLLAAAVIDVPTTVPALAEPDVPERGNVCVLLKDRAPKLVIEHSVREEAPCMNRVGANRNV